MRISRAVVVDSLLGMAAVAVIVTVVLDRLRPSPTSVRAGPVEVRDWSHYGDSARRIGGESARVSLVLFTDYQCPYCRQLWHSMDSVRREFPSEIAITTRHFPLVAIHPRARDAAAFAECARQRGRFESADSALILAQDSIPHLDWTEFARRARVADVTEVEGCMRSGGVLKLIEGDIDAGNKLGLRGTPALLVGSKLYAGTLTARELREAIRAAK